MAVVVSVVLGLVVFGYGMVGSYVTVSELAAHRRVPLAAFVPAGIDGGLISVVVLDLVLVWVGTPVGWLRQVVRLLSMGHDRGQRGERVAGSGCGGPACGGAGDGVGDG
jgi:hypothetical protein